MPIYEYHCATCGADFEKLVLPSTVVECPTCRGQELSRQASVFGLKTGLNLVSPTRGGCGCGAGGCGCARG